MAATAPSDQHLLHQRLVNRDMAALAEIYDNYAPVVFGIALRVTHVRGAAEDITQEIMLDFWRRPHRFDPDRGDLRPWLATLAHNRSVDWLRHELATRRRDQQDLQQASTRAVDVDERVQASMTAERVRRAVAALPQSEGVPIHLAYFAGRSYRQVALDLDLPEGTIKSRIRAGMRHLSRTMATEMAEISA